MHMSKTQRRLVIVSWLAMSCAGEEPPASDADGSGDGVALTSGTTMSSDGKQGDGESGGEKLDVLTPDADGPSGCEPGGGSGMDDGDIEFSYIWIANSPEGTVSKIDTMSGQELGRYYTGPSNGSDDPSRTSVNLTGDVAVTNRSGSITKISAVEERCVDANGNGVIDTSTGMADIRPWGQDECVVWHVDLPSDGGESNTAGPRPTAWDAGSEQDACNVDDDRLWVGWYDFDLVQGHFYRLDGQDGSIIDEVIVPDWPRGFDRYGPYGGAIDGAGNFWVSGLAGILVRIDGETLEVDRWMAPEGTVPYGIALDGQGASGWAASTAT